MSVTSTSLEGTESELVPDEFPALEESREEDECALGQRAATLKDALNKTLEKCIGSIKLSAFKENFKEIDQHYPDALEDLHAQLISQLHASVQNQAENLCKEEKVVKLLNSLDDMVLQSESESIQQRSWRPSGKPKDDVRDHLFQVKLQHKTALENQLQDLLKKNEDLFARVETNHIEIMKLSKQNETYNDLMKVTAALESEERNTLKEKIQIQLMKNCNLED